MTTFICSPGRYLYKGLTIEQPGGTGPWPVNKACEPYKRIPAWVDKIMREWCEIPKAERESYRIGGGCRRVG